MGYPCLVQVCCVGFRFLRFKCHPWMALAIAPIHLLSASERQRTVTRIRCMRALSKIDFAGVYELLNDLLW
ncbi:MAG: hypothetical protein VKK04_03625 [Synechococcales bacterium]|nr:hypothetical protein [Synechococcales bacterium]